MRRTSMALTLALALVAGACGDSDTTASTPAGTDSSETGAPASEQVDDTLISLASMDETSRSVTDALIAAHGDPGAFLALVLAMERGYDIDQIVAAALQNRIDESGSITATEGGLETPSGPRFGVVVVPGDGASAVGMVLAAGPGLMVAQTAELQEPLGLLAQLRDGLAGSLDPDDNRFTLLITVIVELARNGYDLRQTVEAIVTQDPKIGLSRPSGCVLLARSGSQRVVRPENPTDSECSERIRGMAAEYELSRPIEDDPLAAASTTSTTTSKPSGPGILAAASVTQGSGEAAVVIEFFLELCPDGSLDVYGTVTGAGGGSISLRSGSWDPETGLGSLVIINEGADFSVDSTADLTVGDGFVELSGGTVLQIVGQADCG